ncbi:hypothetical protein Vadar_018468 [Vaccinium darrowii]|uniref:Uncharacterized protein n=1 Tax=Vaccinium darrowii TaxID=229202 RepID=A0ACB7XBP8_9ERIC|nr:hypothetical protein Vadar_018468 [Vaccinium darrowii]
MPGENIYGINDNKVLGLHLSTTLWTYGGSPTIRLTRNKSSKRDPTGRRRQFGLAGSIIGWTTITSIGALFPPARLNL